MIIDQSHDLVGSIQRATDEDREVSTRRKYLKLVTAGAASTVVLSSAAGTAGAASKSPGDPSPSNSLVGGGTEYDQTVSGGDYTVTTRDELIEAIETAASGEIVYVPNDAQIDLGTKTKIQIGDGVTLASGRGIDGARGGLLYTNAYTGDDQPAFFEINSSNVRITGLRFRGPRTDYFNPGPEPPCIDDPQADDSACLAARTDQATMAVSIFAQTCEIDNCELYGWPHTAVMTGTIHEPLSPHIHHNSLHHNQMEGLGYGVSVIRGDPLIEWNFFDRNRHSIAGSGRPDCSYVARYNVVDETVSHAFDMHTYIDDERGIEQAGKTIYIRRNTFSFTDSHVPSYADGQEAVAIRGVPTDVAKLTKNWFYHPTRPDDENINEQGQAFRQERTSSWTNFEYSNNHYGSDEPPDGVGTPW